MEEPGTVEPPTIEHDQPPQAKICGLTSLAAAGRVQVLLMAATNKRADEAAEEAKDDDQTAPMQIEDQGPPPGLAPATSGSAKVPDGKKSYEELLKENEALTRDNEGLRMEMKRMEMQHCKEVNMLLYKLINKYAPCHHPDAPSPSPSSAFASTGAFGQAMQHNGHMLQHPQQHRGGGSMDALFNPFGAGPAMSGAGMHHQHMQDPSLRLYAQQPGAGVDHSPSRSRGATPLPPGTLSHALLSQHAPLTSTTPSNGYPSYLPPPLPPQAAPPLSLSAFLNPDPLLSALQGLSSSSSPSMMLAHSHSQGMNGHNAQPPRSTSANPNGGMGGGGGGKRRSRPARSQSSAADGNGNGNGTGNGGAVRVVSVLSDKLWGAVSTGLAEQGVTPKMLDAYVAALHKAMAAFDRSLRKGRKLSGPVTLSTLPELCAFLIRFPKDLVTFFRPSPSPSSPSPSSSSLPPLLSGGLDASPLREFLCLLGLYYSEERDALASLDPLKSAALKRHYSTTAPSTTPTKPAAPHPSSPTVAKPIALSAVLGLAGGPNVVGDSAAKSGAAEGEEAAGSKQSREGQSASAPADAPRAPAVSHILFAPIPSPSTAPPTSTSTSASSAASTSTSTSTPAKPPEAPKPAPAVDKAGSGGVVGSPLPTSPTDANGNSLSSKRASRERRLVSELKALGLLHGPQTDLHTHLDLTQLCGLGLFRHLPNTSSISESRSSNVRNPGASSEGQISTPMHNLFGLFAETDGDTHTSVRVVYVLSRQQHRLPALPRDEWFTVGKIVEEYRKGEFAGISSFCSKDKAAKVKGDLLKCPTERALQAELPPSSSEPPSSSSSSRKRRPSSSSSHSQRESHCPLGPSTHSPMDKRLKAEATASAGSSSGVPKPPHPASGGPQSKAAAPPSNPGISGTKPPPLADPLPIAPLGLKAPPALTQLRPDPSSHCLLDSTLPPDSPSLLDDTTAAELVLAEFITLGVVSARAGVAELRQMDLKDLAGYGMEEFWQVPQVGRRPAVRAQLFAARFSDRVERKQIKGRRVRMIEVVYTDKQVQWFDMQGLLQAYTGHKGLEAKQGIVRFLSREEVALAFERSDAEKLASGGEGGGASVAEDPLLLNNAELAGAEVKPAPVPAPSVGRSGRASVANRRIHDPDWITF